MSHTYAHDIQIHKHKTNAEIAYILHLDDLVCPSRRMNKLCMFETILPELNKIMHVNEPIKNKVL